MGKAPIYITAKDDKALQKFCKENNVIFSMRPERMNIYHGDYIFKCMDRITKTTVTQIVRESELDSMYAIFIALANRLVACRDIMAEED